MNLRNTGGNQRSLPYVLRECKRKVASVCTGCKRLRPTSNQTSLCLIRLGLPRATKGPVHVLENLLIMLLESDG